MDETIIFSSVDTSAARKKVNRISLIIALLIAIAAVGLTVLTGVYYIRSWGEKHVRITEPVVIELSPGLQLNALAIEMAENNLTSSATLFKVWVKHFSDYSRFQAGTYRFEEVASPSMIAKKIIEGETWEPVVLKFTIPEGFTLEQTVKRLAALNIGTEEQLYSVSKNPVFIKQHNIKAKNLEGFLYPATYPFKKIPTPEEAFETMLLTFESRLPENYRQEVKKLGLSLEEAVTFASLIELETAIEDEKPLVSEVIWNRLKKGMALGIDASIIYGIKDFDGNLRFKHLRDKSNLYNTRVHKGLPPTPVGSPSTSSLKAVLNPASEGNWYYVLNTDNNGRHHFSKSLKEHNRHVAKLKAWQKKNR